MKKITVILCSLFMLWACSSNSESNKVASKTNSSKKTTTTKTKKVEESSSLKEGKGVGEIKHVDLNNPLVADMVEKGTAIYDLKCSACHKLTEKRVVGPGFADITTRRKPEWIMNMITNVDIMLKEDPDAQELLKECLIRMPNQNLSNEDARDVLEFLYANDGQEVGS